MPKIISIRPHHMLCTEGYKGFNYNKESKLNWTNLISALKEDPTQNVKITLNEDSFCLECQNSATNKGTCDKNFVQNLDKKIKELLNIEDGEIYPFNTLRTKLLNIMTKEKHHGICKDCGWLKWGLCKDTFEK
ncbi:MAG: DUF1284 domain-containing protein [Clostridiaceae bacterium]|jgi:uncharacterized protein|nr:DUF1284 domain-containing protein [Clostridiaceae bacterium]